MADATATNKKITMTSALTRWLSPKSIPSLVQIRLFDLSHSTSTVFWTLFHPFPLFPVPFHFFPCAISGLGVALVHLQTGM